MLASTSNWWPERRHIIAIGLGRLRAGSNESGATTRLEHREGFLRNVAADSIEDGITTGHDLSEILCVVVDDLIGSELADIVTVRRARRRDHTGADMFCKLNGEAGDPARTALNQDRLAMLQFQRFLDGTYCRETSESQGGGVNM